MVTFGKLAPGRPGRFRPSPGIHGNELKSTTLSWSRSQITLGRGTRREAGGDGCTRVIDHRVRRRRGVGDDGRVPRAGIAGTMRTRSPLAEAVCGSPPQPSGWHHSDVLALDILGPVALRRDGAPQRLTVKKTVALLVLLCRSGSLPRSRVVALLWPQLDEGSGRRNLRRELARLREAGVEDAVQADGDFLSLSTQVASDVSAFDAALASGRPDDALVHWRGALADGLALDDAEAFDEWLSHERWQLLALRRRALEASATAHEARGNHELALQRVDTLLAEDPLQEQHHRDAMRLHMACGRREAALAQFERCRQLLDRELGLQPMAETEDLAAMLRGRAAVQPAAPRVPVADAAQRSAAAPAALLPESLPFVGRRSELTWLEAAWRTGHMLLIEGEAGAGKSRLVNDFAATQGPYALARCRSGDAGVPYASFTRALRVLAGPALDVGDAKPWVRSELARLLPELGVAPPPLRGEAERSRFIEACTLAWLALGADNFDAVILDDWHHADAASRELLAFVAQRRHEQGAHGARELLVYRPELDGEATQAVQRLREDAGAQHLRLGPLASDAVLELLQQLSGAARPERFAARLGRATAGNPFFLAETLRHLAEQQLLGVGPDGQWRTPFDETTEEYRELPVPASVHAAVLARVQRLPASARRVLEAAALAGEPFAPALLAPACALSELDAVMAIEQALAAQLLREHEAGDYVFAHDLVQQAIEASLTPERRRLVHRRLALGAEAAGAPAAVVAAHHEASGDARRAVAHRMAAGDAAQRMHALAGAVAHWQQGLADGPTPSQALALQVRLMRASLMIDQRERSMGCAAALRAMAQDDALTNHERAQAWVEVAGHLASSNHDAECLALLDGAHPMLDACQQAQAMAARAMALRGVGQIEASNAAARVALAMPAMQGLDRANLLDSMVVNEHRAGRSQSALALCEAASALSAQLGDTYGVIRGMYRRGTFLADLGDTAGAVRELQRAAEQAERYGFTLMLRGILFNLVCAHTARTEPALVLATAQRGWDLQPPLPLVELRIMYRLAFVDAHCALGGLGMAWEHAQAAAEESLSLGTQLAIAATAKTCTELFALVGGADIARRLLAAIDGVAVGQMPHVANEMWIARAQAELVGGDVAAARLALAQVAAPDAIESPRERARLSLATAELAWAEGDAPRALALLPRADTPGMNDEMCLGSLAVRVRAEASDGALTAATAAAAQAALQAHAHHAMAALVLYRALSAAQHAGVAGVPADAQRVHAGHVQQLADSLREHPARRAAFLNAYG